MHFFDGVDTASYPWTLQPFALTNGQLRTVTVQVIARGPDSWDSFAYSTYSPRIDSLDRDGGVLSAHQLGGDIQAQNHGGGRKGVSGLPTWAATTNSKAAHISLCLTPADIMAWAGAACRLTWNELNIKEPLVAASPPACIR